jgi:hypothetical protein
MSDLVNSEAIKEKNIRKHIDEISLLGGILYGYYHQLKGTIARKTQDIDSDKRRLRDIIISIRSGQRGVQKEKAVLIETKDVLKKCYRIDVDALETAEEL